jgi:hypothetical protein
MSVTIMEALQNAQHNIVRGQSAFQFAIGKDQLNNAVTLLEKGYPLTAEVDPLLEKYGTADSVPDAP